MVKRMFYPHEFKFVINITRKWDTNQINLEYATVMTTDYAKDAI